MKRVVLSIIFVFMCVLINAQVPEYINYQAIVRDDGEVLSGQSVYYLFSIIKGELPGEVKYTEKHSTSTNQFGLVTLAIGNGTNKTGDFTTIDWGADIYTLKVELDLEGDGSYIDMGTTQLLSVPYALHAKTSSDSFSGDYNELINVPATKHIDSTYIVELTRADEDYIDFGTFENFTNNSDWSVIEKVMMPAGTGSFGGWHFFRGKGWVDQEGDIAIQITTSGIYAWCMQGGWNSVVHNAVYKEERWYTICLQYDATAHTLVLYADSDLVAQITDVLPQDDSGNTNKLFWGGQDVDPSNGQGDLYSETSIVIACQDWLRRKLTLTEIQEYQGNLDSETALFFSSRINSNSVIDGSGNGHDGINGNSPVFLTEVYSDGSDFNEPVHVNDDLYVAGNLVVGGTITGSIKIDTIHVSQITGLLGDGYSLRFPDILDNLGILDVNGIGSNHVVVLNGPGYDVEAIENYNAGGERDDLPGRSMENPIIFEADNTNQTWLSDMESWFNESAPAPKDLAVIIPDVGGIESIRWNCTSFKPGGYEPGVDNRTRFTLNNSQLPDIILQINLQEPDPFGTECSMNLENDPDEVLFDGQKFGCPSLVVDTAQQVMTLTWDFKEAKGIWTYFSRYFQGYDSKFQVVASWMTDHGIKQSTFDECFPLHFQHLTGFGLDKKTILQVKVWYVRMREQ